MFVRAEVVRFGPGAKPFATELDASKAGEAFAGAYYRAFDGARASLLAQYREASQLTFEDQAAAGLAQIADRLQKMPAGKTTPETLDVVPVGTTSLLLLVTGNLVIAGEANPLKFVQAFNLMPEAGTGALYIANEFYQCVAAAAPPPRASALAGEGVCGADWPSMPPHCATAGHPPPRALAGSSTAEKSNGVELPRPPKLSPTIMPPCPPPPCRRRRRRPHQRCQRRGPTRSSTGCSWRGCCARGACHGSAPATGRPGARRSACG